MAQTLVDFQPYGFLLRPRRSPPTPPADLTSNEASMPGFITPPQDPASPANTSRAATPRQDTTIANSEHGKYLFEKLEFIIPPPLNPVERDTPVNARCLFMGHLRFETTTAEVRWLIQRLTGVTALKAEVRGAGCFVVYLASEGDEMKVRGLNRRLLFDHSGVWYARTDEALAHLIEYVDHVMPRTNAARRRALRLPKDSIVVEDTRKPTGSPSHRPAVPTSPFLRGRAPSYHLHMSQGSSNTPSEPGTPQTGFHGTSPPDYVLGDMTPPPPYGSIPRLW